VTRHFLIITVDWRCDAEQYWTSRPSTFDTNFGSVCRGVGQTSHPRYAARLGGMAISMGCCLLSVRDNLRIDATLERPRRDELTARPRRVVASNVNFRGFFVVGRLVCCFESLPGRSVAPLYASSATRTVAQTAANDRSPPKVPVAHHSVTPYNSRNCNGTGSAKSHRTVMGASPSHPANRTGPA
jgi:hypothetical protein